MSTPTVVRTREDIKRVPVSRHDRQRWRWTLRVLGAGLLVASGAIHLDLYVTGYRTIPEIGILFLLQVISAFALAGVILVTGNRLAAAAGAGFAISTLAGYLVSLRISLLGFREVQTTAGVAAGIIEIAAFATLAALALSPATASSAAARSRGRAAGLQRYQPAGRWTAAALTVLAAVLLAIGAAPLPPTSTASGHALLDVRTIGGTAVVTNAQGFTLYWFVPDTPTTSACTSTCAVYWPPVTGTPSAGPGVSGTLGTIHRTDGASQVTYDGHPLYTYIGDNSPGQASGNNINLNGGVWHEMAASG